MRQTARSITGIIWILAGVAFLALAVQAVVTAWRVVHDVPGILAATEVWTRLLLALMSFAFAVIARRVTAEKHAQTPAPPAN